MLCKFQSNTLKKMKNKKLFVFICVYILYFCIGIGFNILIVKDVLRINRTHIKLMILEMKNIIKTL